MGIFVSYFFGRRNGAKQLKEFWIIKRKIHTLKWFLKIMFCFVFFNFADSDNLLSEIPAASTQSRRASPRFEAVL